MSKLDVTPYYMMMYMILRKELTMERKKSTGHLKVGHSDSII